MSRAIVILAALTVGALAQVPGCIFGELGVEVGTHASLDSIESKHRVSLAEHTYVERNDSFVWAGDVVMDWEAAVDQCVYVVNPFKDVWWEGGERFRPQICEAPLSTRTARSCSVSGDLSNNHTISWKNESGPPFFTLHDDTIHYGYVVVEEGDILEITAPGSYQFQNLHLEDGATVWYSGPAGGNVELLAVESIVMEHNVHFVNFGEGEDGFLSLIYADDKAESPLLSRGVEIWSASRDDPQPLRVGMILSQGDIFIGWRRSVHGCLEAARYVHIQNNLYIERLVDPTTAVCA